jgi:hypothetical protein
MNKKLRAILITSIIVILLVISAIGIAFLVKYYPLCLIGLMVFSALSIVVYSIYELVYSSIKD